MVVLANYGPDEYVFEALRAGASGFLLKDTEPADLLQAIQVVARGEALPQLLFLAYESGMVTARGGTRWPRVPVRQGTRAVH